MIYYIKHFVLLYKLQNDLKYPPYEYLQYFFRHFYIPREMSDKRRLVFSIIQFCQEELQSDVLSDDAKESLEVILETP